MTNAFDVDSGAKIWLKDTIVRYAESAGSCFDGAQLTAVNTRFWIISAVSILCGSLAKFTGCKFFWQSGLTAKEDVDKFLETFHAWDSSLNTGIEVKGGSQAVIKETRFDGLTSALFAKGLKSLVTAEGKQRIFGPGVYTDGCTS